MSIGHAGNFVIDAISILKDQNIQPAHFDMRFLSPIDEKLLHNVFDNYNYILTVEDGIITGGMGDKVLKFKNQENYHNKLISIGIPSKFIGHGKVETLHNVCGYDKNGIVEAVKNLIH